MSGKTFLSGVTVCVCAYILSVVALVPRAEAYEWTETQCYYGLCIVYGYVKTTDENGNFTGYARHEISRYYQEDVDSIDP